MNQLVFSFNVSRCSGCLACIVVCQDQNDIVSESIAFHRLTSLEEGSSEDCLLSFLSLSCLHFGDAPCVMVCPTGEIFKDAEDGKMVKCDFCHDRVEAGGAKRGHIFLISRKPRLIAHSTETCFYNSQTQDNEDSTKTICCLAAVAHLYAMMYLAAR